MRFSIYITAAVALLGCTAMNDQAPATPSDLEGVLFIANKRDASLSQVDLASGAEIKRSRSCENPHELALSPDQSHLAVVCYSGTHLQIFTADALDMVKEIELGEGARPHGILWLENGQIVATAEGRGTIFTVTSPFANKPTVREIGKANGSGPHMVAVSGDGATAWGAAIPTDTVMRYDLASGRETHRIVLSGRTEGIALAPGGGGLFVSTLEESRVFRLDPATLEKQADIAVGAIPIRVMAHPGGRYLVTSDLGDGALSVIDADSNTVVRTIPVSGGQDTAQVTVIFSPDGERLYVAETAMNTVAEIDFASGEVLRRLSGGPGGDGLAVTN